MFILILFVLLLIANIVGGIMFASKWKTERKKDSAPTVVYIVLIIAALIAFLLILPYTSKIFLAFMGLGFREIFVYTYIGAIIFISVMIISDWKSLENTDFVKSWQTLLFTILPLCVFVLMMGIFYYARKTGGLGKLLDTSGSKGLSIFGNNKTNKEIYDIDKTEGYI